MRTFVLAAAAATALLIPAAGPAAAAPAPFGHPCTAQNGIRFCPATTLAQRVPSWDGTPIDVDVSLPPTGNGPFPTIVMLHGVGSTKTMFESTTPEGSGPIFWHANNDFYAQQGYAVVNYSQRGWGNSCGTPASRVGTPACDEGWIHLADTRYDTHDLQHLVGQEGRVLDALQELTRLAATRETGERSRLMLDIAGHRAARRAEWPRDTATPGRRDR